MRYTANQVIHIELFSQYCRLTELCNYKYVYLKKVKSSAKLVNRFATYSSYVSILSKYNLHMKYHVLSNYTLTTRQRDG